METRSPPSKTNRPKRNRADDLEKLIINLNFKIMKKIIVTALLLIIGMTGCINYDCCPGPEHFLELIYKNNQGEELLSKDSKIRVFYEIDGNKKDAFEAIAECEYGKPSPYWVSVDKDSIISLTVAVNTLYQKNYIYTTYLQLDDYPIDTIKSIHDKNTIKKVWVNNKLMNSKGRNIIIK